MTYISDKRLCLDAAGKVVDCDAIEARELLIGEGGEMTDEQAAKYGLTKARDQAANKARTASENK